VARFRKTAIAVLAVSALALAPTAAYAHDHHGVAGSSGRGMSWATYSGELTDYTTNPDPKTYPDIKPDIFKDARASAIMIGLNGRSLFRLRVSGIDAKDGTYGVHLHQGTCNAENFDDAGPHYNVTWAKTGLMGDANKKTEVWLDLKVNSDGSARSTATVDFIPKGERSIVLHAAPTMASGPTAGTAGPRLACLPFNINAYGN
jgi:hypothetical protein